MSLGRLDPCKMAVVHRLCDTDHEGRLNSVNHYSWSAEQRNKPHTYTVSDEAWSYLDGYARSQINRYWSAENTVLNHGVALCDVKVGVRCVWVQVQ